MHVPLPKINSEFASRCKNATGDDLSLANLTLEVADEYRYRNLPSETEAYFNFKRLPISQQNESYRKMLAVPSFFSYVSQSEQIQNENRSNKLHLERMIEVFAEHGKKKEIYELTVVLNTHK